MEVIFQGLNTAYVLFSLFLAIYAVWLAGSGTALSGNFWGAMWTNTGLAATIFIIALVMTVMGLRPYGSDPDTGRRAIRWVYYLYAIYFMISLPGVFTLSGGNDRSLYGLLYGLVSAFNAAAAYRAGNVLVTDWD